MGVTVRFKRAVERGVAGASVLLRLKNFQMTQRGVVQREKIAALIKRSRVRCWMSRRKC
jgi:hypothetical protein